MKIKEFLPGLSIAILISLASMVPWKLISYYWWACPWFIYRTSARNYSKRFSET